MKMQTTNKREAKKTAFKIKRQVPEQPKEKDPEIVRALEALAKMNELYFKANWPRIKNNVKRNMKRSHADWHKYAGALKDSVAINCGAGPSLEKNMPLIRELCEKRRDSVWIFCANRAFPLFDEYGIIPDFVIAVDRISKPIKRKKLKGESVNLISTYECNPDFTKHWEGPIHYTVGGALDTSDLTTNRKLELLIPYFQKVCNNRDAVRRSELMKKGKLDEFVPSRLAIRRFPSGGNVGTFSNVIIDKWFGARAQIFIGHDYGGSKPFPGCVQFRNKQGELIDLYTRSDYWRYAKYQEHRYLNLFAEDNERCNFAVNCSLEGVFNRGEVIPNILNMEFKKILPSLIKGGDAMELFIKDWVEKHPFDLDEKLQLMDESIEQIQKANEDDLERLRQNVEKH